MQNQHQLAVILFADIVGYTALMQKDEQLALAALQKFKYHVNTKSSEHDGRIVQYFGDGCLISFSSCTAAVSCAISLQRALQEHPVVSTRIGLHMGEIFFDGHNAYGDGVNIASRIESMGIPGSILVSKTITDQIRNKSLFVIKSLGFHQFKNVSEAMEIFAIANTGIVVPEKKVVELTHSVPGSGANKLTWLVLSALIIGLLGYMFWREGQMNNDMIQPFTLKPLSISSWCEGWESWSPNGDMYAYVSLESGDGDLYIRNIKGGKSVQITDTPYDEYLPRWSPDGGKIAYASIRNSKCNIYCIPPTGGAEKLLATTNIPGIEQSVTTFFCLGGSPWNADGTKILFSAMDKDRTVSIWQVDVNTGQLAPVTFPPSGHQDLMASWSRDGQNVVFTRNQRLYLKGFPDGAANPVLPESEQASMPIFNADDSKIIFSLMKPGDQNIWDYDLKTRNMRQVTHLNKHAWGASLIHGQGGISVDEFSHQIDIIKLIIEDGTEEQLSFYNGDNSYGRFSPNGQQIIYQSDRTGNLEIWMLSLNDSDGETNLTNHPATDFKPDWSPDGSRIAFFSNREGPYHLWVMNTSGLGLQKVGDAAIELGTTLIKTVHQVKWSPQGRKIGYLALGPRGPSLWIVDVESDHSTVAIAGVNSFAWYKNDGMIIYHRQNPDSADQSQLVAINFTTGMTKVLAQNIPLTELFIDSNYHWLGYTTAIGHFSYALHRLAIDTLSDEQGFPAISKQSEELANGAGRWHVHNGCFSPDGGSVIYSRDADQMDIYLISEYR